MDVGRAPAGAGGVAAAVIGVVSVVLSEAIGHRELSGLLVPLVPQRYLRRLRFLRSHARLWRAMERTSIPLQWQRPHYHATFWNAAAKRPSRRSWRSPTNCTRYWRMRVSDRVAIWRN